MKKCAGALILMFVIVLNSFAETLNMNLLKEEYLWSNFTPRNEIATLFSKVSNMECDDCPALVINGNNNPNSVGGWIRKLPILYKNHRYQVEASFRTDRVEDINKSIRAIITNNKREFIELYRLEKKDRWYRLSVDFTPIQDEDKLEIILFLTGSGKGTVQWSHVNLKEITDEFKPRLVNLAAISGRPLNAKKPSEAIEYYCERIDAIGHKKLDLICLGENINVDNVPGDRSVMAEKIPGPSTLRLGQKAKEYNTYIATSILERDGSLIYNTAVLIDRKGNVVGKYRKIHLTLVEELIRGIKPGNEYPVFQTDFAKVGLMVCYDNHFPEVARILAVKGAELIAYPNMSDGRGLKGEVWQPYMKTRAIDNHVQIVSAVNYGRSCIVNAKGEILDINKRYTKEPGDIVFATVDLNDSVTNWSGRSIQKRYLLVRRPNTYGPLLQHSWEFDGLTCP